MEQETFFSGYCRCMDSSRMVAVVTLDGKLEEADCNYENCPYATDCPIALQITQLLQK